MGADVRRPHDGAGQRLSHGGVLHHNYFRTYDPETARNLTPDPLGLGPAPNPAAYVINPHTWSDPFGLSPEGEHEWADPADINFSQRTVSPNDYVERMRAGDWDWRRPGAALTVMEVDGQLVSYDNRRLDAAREIGDPVTIHRVSPNDQYPPSPKNVTWKRGIRNGRITCLTNKARVQEEEMSAIERLWADYQLPDVDGLFFPDGRSYEVCLDVDSASGMRFGGAFDLEEVLAEDPDWITDIGRNHSVPLADGGFLWGGEGVSYGSYGFCGRLHADRTLIWALSFEDSNPFADIQVSGSTAVFRSTSGVSITVDIDDPLRSGAA